VVAPGAARAENQTWPAAVVSLEGNDWRVAADPANAGRQQAWWQGPVAEARAGRVPGILQETLPGYHGVAWYWHEFIAPAQPYSNGRCLIRFQAVDYLAQVWLNDISVGGQEGGETPFTLDITHAMKPGLTNRLAVRVLNPTAERIDGVVLAETPHRNKVPAGIGVGGSYNSGGITEPVDVFWTPAVRIDDVYALPDWKSGAVNVQVTLSNASALAQSGRLDLVITADSANPNEPAARMSVSRDFPPGTSQTECQLNVEAHRLWRLEDPYLYRLTTRLTTGDHSDTHENSVRFGFRDLRVEQGYFRLNGKRIFLKSSHTGNHCPIGAVVPPAGALDLLRKDLLYMKACGFNTVRFISGIAILTSSSCATRSACWSMRRTSPRGCWPIHQKWRNALTPLCARWCGATGTIRAWLFLVW
jgi:beta-galactosidase/beta-glucuronidase